MSADLRFAPRTYGMTWTQYALLHGWIQTQAWKLV